MGTCACRYLDATEHPRDLLGAGVVSQRGDGRARGLAVGQLDDPEVLMPL
jgi:hypothetical protein